MWMRCHDSILRVALFSCLPLLFSLFTTQAADELPTFSRIQERYETVHAHVAPAVVAVQCAGGTKTGAGFYGTGVVVSPEGLALTSATVVPAGTKSVEVLFTDGRVMNAKVLAFDNTTESCLLQITRGAEESKTPLPYLELADSSKIHVGELAYSAGNPFHTISRDGQVAWSVGTISGAYKINSADEQSHYTGMILETDAAVNPGSDGGSLVDENGRLLGILSLCFCESRWLGTAIPVHLIKKGFPELKNVALVDPKTPPGFGNADGIEVSRAIPEALVASSRPAANAMVKVIVHRNCINTNDHHASLMTRLRQRPDAPVSGVIIDSEGYILTSAFNVEGDVCALDVQLNDGTSIPATLLGRDLGLDVAVLKIEHPKGLLLPAIPLAGDPELKIGRFIAILGSSEEGPPTRTLGIVSALGRLDGTAVQTDALTNYGNSGGAVVDLNGKLVGIASQVRTHTDWSENSGVGFFTQSDKIIQSLADLKAGRNIKAPARPFLGVSHVENATEVRGVKLEEVIPASAAANARLQAGDVIVAVDGMDTQSWPALVRILKAHHPGDSIEITYQRGSVTTRAQTVLTSRKDVR
jgi:S1-C subfamily serine protease